jgi:hypothetical protein
MEYKLQEEEVVPEGEGRVEETLVEEPLAEPQDETPQEEEEKGWYGNH